MPKEAAPAHTKPTHTPRTAYKQPRPPSPRARAEACASAARGNGPSHPLDAPPRHGGAHGPARARKWALSRPLDAPPRASGAPRHARTETGPHTPPPHDPATAEGSHTARYAEFPTMPDYDISASLDLLLSKPWDDVLAENPKFKQATENWGAQTAANYKSVWKAESKPSLSSHLTGYINDGKFEPSSLVVKGA